MRRSQSDDSAIIAVSACLVTPMQRAVVMLKWLVTMLVEADREPTNMDSVGARMSAFQGSTWCKSMTTTPIATANRSPTIILPCY